MLYLNNILLYYLCIFIYGQLSQSIVDSLPIYNPSTRCHDLTFSDQNLTFAICLQRATNKQHPYNLHTSSSFCSINYPPNGHLVDLISLPNSLVDRFLQNLIDLFKTKSSFISLPEPNFLWVNSSTITNLTENKFWCPDQCQPKNSLGKFLILKLRCQFNNNNSKSCLTTKHTHWDRAPFICLTNQVTKEKKQIPFASIRIPPSYSNNTIVFYDSKSCVIVRTNTHEYTFCFRRQSCPYSQTSAFCTTKLDALDICNKEKHQSNLLTIENSDEYQLITDVIHYFSNQTLLNINGSVKNKYIQRAQWMWIDGIKDSNDTYRWNTSENILTPILDKYWCDNITNCAGGKGRDHVVLNIVCQTNKKFSQICLASRRQSEPGPFICKRVLKPNEAPILNYTLLKDVMNRSPSVSEVVPVYELDSTSLYYDEHHCLTTQTLTHLYTFCFRRQNCTPRQAFCTKWSQAQKNCQLLKDQAQLLTIDNQPERLLITDVLRKYINETRLTFNGSSYRYFQLADFLWIDGKQKADNRTYSWKNGLEIIPENLWCPKSQCNSIDRPRVMLNLLCQNNNSLACLGTRVEWKPAPYVCKRIRPKDPCPILFDKIRVIKWNEMLVVTVNRTIALIKCKHPEYNTEIRVQYQCDIQRKQWNLIYENKNFICPGYEIPPMQISVNTAQPSRKTTIRTSTRPSYATTTISSTTKEPDCSQSDLSSFISRLPTESRHIYYQKIHSQSSSYYDMRLTCYFNDLIQITYRCDLLTKQWIYVYGNTNSFQRCYPLCSNNERNDLLNKFFTLSEQAKIQTVYLQKRKALRLRCFNPYDRQWKSINYKCGTLTITKYQWFKLHSCFQSTVITQTPPPPPPTTTTTTTVLPPVMVSLAVDQLPPSCPSSVIQSYQCPYETGQYIFDLNGCLRKICPTMSRLCDTIRCPPDRICRVVPCKSCYHTDYLQAVCEYRTELSLCEFDKQLLLLNDNQSINRWERQVMDIVRRYADEQRQRLISPWPVLTIN